MSNALRAVLAIALAISLSGCASSSVKTTATPSPTFATVATVTSDTGGIEGKVLDEEARPLAGASVGVMRTTLPIVTTTSSGEFAFSEVAVGKQNLVVSAIGFNEKVVGVEIRPGEIAQINVTLVIKPIELTPNELTPAQNALFLHAQNSPRVYWLSTVRGAEKLETADHNMDCAGYNSLAVALGATVSEWNLRIAPDLPNNVSLDPTKTIHVLVYICPFFNGDDIGVVKLNTRIMNGDKVLAESDVRDVSYQGNVVKVEWDLTPAQPSIDSSKGFEWYIRAEGYYVAGIGLGVCRKCEQQSTLTFPIV